MKRLIGVYSISLYWIEGKKINLIFTFCHQANQREESYKEQIKTLTTKLKQVWSKAKETRSLYCVSLLYHPLIRPTLKQNNQSQPYVFNCTQSNHEFESNKLFLNEKKIQSKTEFDLLMH